jgi:hypothetical protein
MADGCTLANFFGRKHTHDFFFCKKAHSRNRRVGTCHTYKSRSIVLLLLLWYYVEVGIWRSYTGERKIGE